MKPEKPHAGLLKKDLSPGQWYRDSLSGRKVLVLPNVAEHKAFKGSAVPNVALVYNVVYARQEMINLHDNQLIPLSEPWTP